LSAAGGGGDDGVWWTEVPRRAIDSDENVDLLRLLLDRKEKMSPT